MNKRLISVSIVAVFFIAAGVLGILYHAPEFTVRSPFDVDVVWAVTVRLLAIVGGVFLLRGANWARWLVLGWMAYHVAVSAFHSVEQLVTHAVLTGVMTYLLLRPAASRFFRRQESSGAPTAP